MSKAKYWLAVLYPENMRPDWKNEIGDLLGYPYAYCIHDKDKTKDGEARKTHVHMILALSNTTTENHAMNIFSKLNADGKRALNAIKPAVNIAHAYAYLIHDTETSRKVGKHLYAKSERITGNNFDIVSKLPMRQSTAEESERASAPSRENPSPSILPKVSTGRKKSR